MPARLRVCQPEEIPMTDTPRDPHADSSPNTHRDSYGGTYGHAHGSSGDRAQSPREYFYPDDC